MFLILLLLLPLPGRTETLPTDLPDVDEDTLDNEVEGVEEGEEEEEDGGGVAA